MIEKRKKIQPVVDLLEYMIRCGKISNEGGHKIFSVVLKDPDLTDRVRRQWLSIRRDFWEH